MEQTSSNVSLLFWNVHNLRNEQHASQITEYIKKVDPDIFALAEVVGPPAYDLISKKFPEHNFYMTYGQEAQELLVGVRRNWQTFFSQKTEFNSGNIFVRPGVLVTLSNKENPLNILFVHPKSLSSPSDFGQRDGFYQQVLALKKRLDERVKGEARFLLCGDLNIMGMDYGQKNSISSEDELYHFSIAAKKVGMTFLSKEHNTTWTNGSRSYDLDHILASNSVNIIKQQRGENKYEVSVGGWIDLPDKSIERKQFVNEISDHCFLTTQIEF